MTIYSYDPIWWNKVKKEVVKDAFDIQAAVQKSLYGYPAVPVSHIGLFGRTVEKSSSFNKNEALKQESDNKPAPGRKE